MFFLFNPLRAGKFKLQKDRFVLDIILAEWRNIRICIHGASWMERKRCKCWKLQLFEGKLWVFSYLSKMKTVSMSCNSSLFWACLYHFLFLEISKFKYDFFFIRNSAAISKFDWFEQLRGNYKITLSIVQLELDI